MITLLVFTGLGAFFILFGLLFRKEKCLYFLRVHVKLSEMAKKELNKERVGKLAGTVFLVLGGSSVLTGILAAFITRAEIAFVVVFLLIVLFGIVFLTMAISRIAIQESQNAPPTDPDKEGDDKSTPLTREQFLI